MGSKQKTTSYGTSGVSYKTAAIVMAMTACAGGGVLWLAGQHDPQPQAQPRPDTSLTQAAPSAEPARLNTGRRAPATQQASESTETDQPSITPAQPTDTDATGTDLQALTEAELALQAIVEALTPDADQPLDAPIADAEPATPKPRLPHLGPLVTDNAGSGSGGSTVVGGSSGGGGGGGGSSIGGGSSGGGGGGGSGGGGAGTADASGGDSGSTGGGPIAAGAAPGPTDPADTISYAGDEALDLSKPIAADPDLVARIDVALMNQLRAGGNVHIPAGEHVIGSVDIQFPITLTADEDAKLILAVGSKDPFGLRLLADDSSIDGLSIDRGPGRSGITVEADGVTIENCSITGAKSPENQTHGVGIYVRQSSKRIRLLDNQVRNGGIGIYTSRFLEDIVIANNLVEDIQAEHGIYCAQANDLLIEGNTIRRVNHIGIKSQNDHLSNTDSVNVSIIGNTIEDAGNNAIACTRTPVSTKGDHIDLIIRNNIVKNAGGNGIRLRHVDGVLIRGNRLTNVNGDERFEWTENIER